VCASTQQKAAAVLDKDSNDVKEQDAVVLMDFIALALVRHAYAPTPCAHPRRSPLNAPTAPAVYCLLSAVYCPLAEDGFLLSISNPLNSGHHASLLIPLL
jgi:hypothetical protein